MQLNPNRILQACSHVAVPAAFSTDSTTVTGTGFDCKDALWVQAFGMVGTSSAGTTLFKIEESEDNSSFTAVTNATTGAVNTASRMYKIVVRQWAGVQKRYARLSIVNAGFTGIRGGFLEICLSKAQVASDESSVVVVTV